MAVKVDVDTCTGCGACISVCPASVLSISDDGKPVCNEGARINYGLCASARPISAIPQ